VQREGSGGGWARFAVAAVIGALSISTLAVVVPPPVAASTDPVPWPGPRQVALTFDDGPGTATTAVLDVLQRYGVPATFFVLGTAIGGREGTLQRMASSGHSVQNHTWNHPSLPSLSNGSIQSQLVSTSNRIAGAIGVAPTCFRPPGGNTNARVVSAAAAVGLRQIMWTDDPWDWNGTSAGGIVSRVLAGANGSGRVVLLHDGGPRWNTVAALPSLIEGFHARGYEFVPLCNTVPPPEVYDCQGRELPAELGLPPAEPGRFEPIAPSRALDTRTATGTVAGLVGAGCGVAVTVAGAGGVPADATAVALSVVATESRRAGYVTAWACGAPRPLASILNPQPGVDIAGSVVVPVGDGGRVCLHSSTGTHLVADVTGWFGPGASQGFAPVPPVRVADSRTGPFAPGLRRVEPFEVVAVPVADQGGIPADATGAAITVTATEAQAAGWVRAFPCDATPPPTSTVNIRPGDDRAALAVVGLGGGQVCLQANVRVHLVVDASGWFSASAPALFHPAGPSRRFDTRDVTGGVPSLGPTSSPAVTLAGTAGVPPAGASAVLWTLTATDAAARGWVAARPCDTSGLTSVVNPLRGSAVAASAITPLDAAGGVCLAANVNTHLVGDVAGWFC
jgi:peptidoglycan/xylan/chitin deacetylase (PgdA/CDA1 family)